MAQSILDLILRTKKEGNADKEAVGGLRSLSAGFEGLTGISLGAAAAFGAVTGAIKFSIDAAAEAEKVSAQVEAVIKSTGGAAGLTADEINAMAAEMSALTGIEDDLIARNEAVLLTFTKIGKDVFPDATMAALNMSSALEQDLQSSIVQVGKALNDPIAGITALSRVGVAFTQEQKEMIRTLVESGDVLGAQRVILAELETEFGGAAEAAGDTFAGSVAKLQNSLGNLAEAVGGLLIPQLKEFFDLLAQGVEIISLLFNWDAKVVAGLEEHAAQVRRSSASYADYYDELYRAARAAGYLIDAQGDLVDSNGRLIIDGYVLFEWERKLTNAAEERAAATAEAARQVEQWTSVQQDEIETEMLLSHVTDELAQGIYRMATGTETGAEAMKRLNNQARAAAEAAREARPDMDKFFDGLDRQIASPIEAFIADLKWMAAGGGVFTEQFANIQKALLEGRITPEQAQTLTEALYVNVQGLQVEMDELTADEAAKNVSETLGVSLTEADTLLDEIQTKGNTDMNAALAIAVQVTGSKLALGLANAWLEGVDLDTGGGGAGGGSGGGGGGGATTGEDGGGGGRTDSHGGATLRGGSGSSAYSIVVEQYFYGAVEAVAVKDASRQGVAEGVLAAQRARGLA